jgi:hypothetical protein
MTNHSNYSLLSDYKKSDTYEHHRGLVEEHPVCSQKVENVSLKGP